MVGGTCLGAILLDNPHTLTSAQSSSIYSLRGCSMSEDLAVMSLPSQSSLLSVY